MDTALGCDIRIIAESDVHHVYLQLLPLFQTHDMQEGTRAFMEKREPKFEGR